MYEGNCERAHYSIEYKPCVVDKSNYKLRMAVRNNVLLFSPLLADAQKIGFFSLDRTTQTEVTDIIQLKELTETVEQLLEVRNTTAKLW